ncbi:MAG: metal-sulfur cluster assembly factor [Gaiellaceae bacterium]
MSCAATKPVEAQALRAALAEVLDPEYPVSLVDLGLIRGARVEGTTAHVELVFCNLGCPCTELIEEDIVERLLPLDGVDAVEIEEVFDRWTRSDVSARGLKQLRQVGVA